MDIFKRLNETSTYSTTALQVILGAWVLAAPFERTQKVCLETGDVPEEDYDKRSIYSLLYSLYGSVGEVRSESGERYEFTFNTWGYAWPEAWGPAPTPSSDPQRFGKNAYTGLFAFPQAKDYVAQRNGKVHVVELGCGTGAGAHLVCKHVLPEATYQAVDMQAAAIGTCNRKFVPELGGRLTATQGDATRVSIKQGGADFVAVCETHVTEFPGVVTDEDKAFFQAAHRALKPGGLLTWGNAIPDSTWQPCFDYLASIGMRLVECRDVTQEAIAARDQDAARISAYANQCIDKFAGFRIPYIGSKKRVEARLALENFSRNPGTSLYNRLVDRTDTYRVALLEKTA